jgi:hypothetical protein
VLTSTHGFAGNTDVTPDLQELFLKLGRDRRLAHQSLFKHRHTNETPAFHTEIINLWHSHSPAALVMVFREGGKSTIAEEAFVIGAGYQLFHNALIIGSTEKRACERLRAIKHEIETNENVQLLFGDLRGHTWNEAEVILGNGVRIIAVGRGQSLRGTKHLHYRPDFCFCDDIEEDENVCTPEARDETLSWFMSTVIPALDVTARIRVNATPLDREALPFTLQNKLKWPTRVYPIEYIDEHGERQPTWPARYPLAWIDQKRREFEAAGKIQDFMREYMCVADDPTRKIFTADMFKVRPVVRTWQPTFAFFDPARTVKSTSASTGWAVWSWVANRMTVWDGGGGLWRPDEIVSQVFAVDETYRPVAIGVEEDGLNEFLMQPLRHEMVKRASVVPVIPWRAPRGKLSFIESLQPFFRAGEITFAKDLPELQAQFLNFPSGRIDGPNALAYALLMRPGQVVYDDFSGDHVVDAGVVNTRRPCFLCLHARDGVVTGVMVQFANGALAILADWIVEGDPGSAVSQIVKEASLGTETLKLVAPAEHFGAFNHLGLRGAVAKIPADLLRGGSGEVGRDELRALLQRRIKGRPALAVAMTARWSLNAFAAGYAYEVGRDGRLTSEPRRGVYRCLMEGLECFTGMLGSGIMADHGRPNVQRTASGQVYISALPGKSEIADAKDSFPSAGAVNASLSARR